MKLTTNNLRIDDKFIMLPVPIHMVQDVEKLAKALRDGKQLDFELKVHRQKRSLNANAALWAMLNDMAKVIRTTSKELYLKALEDYGTSRFMAIEEADFEAECKCHRLVKKQGYTYANGYRFLVIQVWDGSSTYNSEEFSVLLDGVIQDAKDLGVDFISRADKMALLEDWNNGN